MRMNGFWRERSKREVERSSAGDRRRSFAELIRAVKWLGVAVFFGFCCWVIWWLWEFLPGAEGYVLFTGPMVVLGGICLLALGVAAASVTDWWRSGRTKGV